MCSPTNKSKDACNRCKTGLVWSGLVQRHAHAHDGSDTPSSCLCSLVDDLQGSNSLNRDGMARGALGGNRDEIRLVLALPVLHDEGDKPFEMLRSMVAWASPTLMTARNVTSALLALL